MELAKYLLVPSLFGLFRQAIKFTHSRCFQLIFKNYVNQVLITTSKPEYLGNPFRQIRILCKTMLNKSYLKMKNLGKTTLLACSMAFLFFSCESKRPDNAAENTEQVIEQENSAASDTEDANNPSVEGDTKETGDNIEDQAENAAAQTKAAATEAGSDIKEAGQQAGDKLKQAGQEIKQEAKEAGAEIKQEAQGAGAKLKEGARNAKSKIKEEANEANAAIDNARKE